MTGASRLCGAAVLAIACSGPQLGGWPREGPQTADAVLARALARPTPNTLQGTARLDAFIDGERRSGTLLIALAAPHSLQVQVLSPTLDLLALVATDGKRFTSFQRGGRQCQTGVACAASLGRLLPIPLPPEQLVGAWLGRPPLFDGTRTLHWDAERSLYRIDIEHAARLQQVFVRPDTFAFAGSVLLRDGARVASLAYEGEKAGVPARLRWQAPGDKVDVTVELRDVEAGVAIEPGRFQIACPTGMAVIELPCDASETVDGAPPGLRAAPVRLQ
ncbi:MAG: hypothetical protein EXR79_00210 [Myxococcales bacterium]|nr:hypothetical protein [Myxococcales bacterium]